MLIADSSYPLLNVFWTMFEFFLWVIWIWILIVVFIDIFRSQDLSGWGDRASRTGRQVAGFSMPAQAPDRWGQGVACLTRAG